MNCITWRAEMSHSIYLHFPPPTMLFWYASDPSYYHNLLISKFSLPPYSIDLHMLPPYTLLIWTCSLLPYSIDLQFLPPVTRDIWSANFPFWTYILIYYFAKAPPVTTIDLPVLPPVTLYWSASVPSLGEWLSCQALDWSADTMTDYSQPIGRRQKQQKMSLSYHRIIFHQIFSLPPPSLSLTLYIYTYHT